MGFGHGTSDSSIGVILLWITTTRPTRDAAGAPAARADHQRCIGRAQFVHLMTGDQHYKREWRRTQSMRSVR